MARNSECRDTPCLGLQLVISFSFLICSIFCFVMSVGVLAIRHFAIAATFGFLSIFFAAVSTVLFLDARGYLQKLRRLKMTHRLKVRQARARAEQMENLARLAIQRENREADEDENNNRDSVADFFVVPGSAGSESLV